MAMFLSYYRRVTLTGAYKNLGMVSRGNFEALRSGVAFGDLTSGFPFSGTALIVQGEHPEKIPGKTVAEMLKSGQAVKVWTEEAAELVKRATSMHAHPTSPLFT